jgi:hypothetical protein
MQFRDWLAPKSICWQQRRRRPNSCFLSSNRGWKSLKVSPELSRKMQLGDWPPPSPICWQQWRRRPNRRRHGVLGGKVTGRQRLEEQHCLGEWRSGRGDLDGCGAKEPRAIEKKIEGLPINANLVGFDQGDQGPKASAWFEGRGRGENKPFWIVGWIRTYGWDFIFQPSLYFYK